MKKKIIAFGLASILCLSLAACGGSKGLEESNSNTPIKDSLTPTAQELVDGISETLDSHYKGSIEYTADMNMNSDITEDNVEDTTMSLSLVANITSVPNLMFMDGNISMTLFGITQSQVYRLYVADGLVYMYDVDSDSWIKRVSDYEVSAGSIDYVTNLLDVDFTDLKLQEYKDGDEYYVVTAKTRINEDDNDSVSIDAIESNAEEGNKQGVIVDSVREPDTMLDVTLKFDPSTKTLREVYYELPNALEQGGMSINNLSMLVKISSVGDAIVLELPEDIINNAVSVDDTDTSENDELPEYDDAGQTDEEIDDGSAIEVKDNEKTR